MSILTTPVFAALRCAGTVYATALCRVSPSVHLSQAAVLSKQ